MKKCLYLNKLKKFLFDTILPLNCIGCNNKNEILCDICISNIKLVERETGENIIAMFDYRNTIIKKSIWMLKYHHKRYIGEKLGQLLYEHMLENISDMKIQVAGRSIFVIPVPISHQKTRLRGYNQSLSIAKGFCEKENKNILEIKKDIVFKKINTLPQAKITNKKRRLENIKGVFDIKNGEIIKGRTIIVIDDVTTTGATMNEVMKILKKFGAKKVVGFAVAH